MYRTYAVSHVYVLLSVHIIIDSLIVEYDAHNNGRKLGRSEEPMHMHTIEFHVAIFVWFLCFFGPLSRALVAYHPKRCGMPLYDAIGVNCEKGATTDIKAQVPSMWAQGCMLDNCAWVIWHDLTTPLPDGGRMSGHIVINNRSSV